MVSRRSLLAAISIAALTLAGTPAALAHHSQAGTIKLGFFGPLSAGSAAAGQDMLNAMKLAVNAANKAGGVLGEQITIDAQDDQCTAQLSVTAAQKLVTDGVIGVVGGYCSGATIPASTIYHRAGIPIITPAATNPRLTAQGFNDVFRTIGRDDFQGVFAAKLFNSLHAKSVAIVHDNTTYAKGLATYTQAALQKNFPSIKVVFFDAITPGSKDFTGILTKIKSLKPDATYFTGYYADGGLFVKQFEQLGVGGQIMAGDGNNDPTFIKLAGKAAEKTIITGAPIPQFVPSAAGFVKQYTAAYGTGPGAYSAYTYDATNVMLHAITVAKTTDAAALVKAVAATKNFAGVTGPITFTASGDRLQIQYIAMTVKNGQFVRWSM
jgi:ABC-type branched-subunit amino acid transport system substrate-binding protein